MGEAGESERGGLRVGGKYSGESFFFFFFKWETPFPPYLGIDKLLISKFYETLKIRNCVFFHDSLTYHIILSTGNLYRQITLTGVIMWQRYSFTFSIG